MFWNRSSSSQSNDYPADWSRRRQKIFRKDAWACQSCGRKGGKKGNAELHAHHVVPKSKGGGHELDNLTTVCDRCHANIHDDPRLLADDQKDTSSIGTHALIAALTVWWTAGVGNLAYEFYRRRNNNDRKHAKKRKNGVKILRKAARNGSGLTKFGDTKIGQDGIPRLGKRHEKKGFWQKRADKGRNRKYGGCPSCGQANLTVSWLKLTDGSKAKAVECTSCGGMFDESNDQLTQVEKPAELNSGGSAVMQELFG